MSKAVKIKIYKTMVEPFVVFGSEPWARLEMDIETLGTWVTKMLRRIDGRVAEQLIWRIRANEESRKLYKDVDSSRY